MARKRIRNDQWKRIEQVLPIKVVDSAAATKDDRLFLEAVLWIAHTGSAWRNLPPQLGNWHATFTRFSRWRRKGVWQRIIDAISDDAELQALLTYSTAARARQYGDYAPKRKGHKHPDAHPRF